MQLSAGEQSYHVQQTRKVLLILLIIQMVFAFYNLIAQSVSLNDYGSGSSEHSSAVASVIQAVLSLVYICIFIYFVFKYLHVGIRICAWVGIIRIILTIIITILAIVAIIAIAPYYAGTTLAVSAIVIVVAALDIAMAIFTVIYALRLAKYLEADGAYPNV